MYKIIIIILSLFVASDSYADEFLKWFKKYNEREVELSQQKRWAEQWPAQKYEYTIKHQNAPSIDADTWARALGAVRNNDSKPANNGVQNSPFYSSPMPDYSALLGISKD